MIAEWKEKWLAALRGGKYTQACGALRWGQCYCAIGVLCDLIDDTEWELSGIKVGEKAAYMFRGSVASLDREDLEKIGLTREQQNTVIHLNESGKSFKSIATYIEKNF